MPGVSVELLPEVVPAGVEEEVKDSEPEVLGISVELLLGRVSVVDTSEVVGIAEVLKVVKVLGTSEVELGEVEMEDSEGLEVGV